MTVAHKNRLVGFFAVSFANVLGLLPVIPPNACFSASPDKPNIVLILADDLGFSDLGCYGSEILTPNLDRMANHGLRFTQFYNCGRSCPTRASLLTGLWAHETGMGCIAHDYGRPGYRGNLNRDCATIAELLRGAGYQAYMCGKWHLTRFVDPAGPKHSWPLQRGFDHFYGTIHGAGSYFDPATLCSDNHYLRATGDYYYTDALSDHAARFVEQAAASQRPFFLLVAYSAPHWPLHAPENVVSRYRSTYAIGWDSLRKQRYQRLISQRIISPRWALTLRDPRVRAWEQNSYKSWQQRRMAVYAAQVDLMDRGIGRIMEKLRQSGQEHNTLVMFLSDNGACAEEVASSWKGIHVPTRTLQGNSVHSGNNPNVLPGPAESYQSYGVAWANASNTPFRLYKHYVHEGGIATPLVCYWPAVITRRGALTHDSGHVVDVMPTLLQAAKLSYPRNLGGYTLKPSSGESLMPILQGGNRRRRPMFWEHEGNKAVRDGKWKLVARHRGNWELYDMEADRTELKDLAASPRYRVMVEDLTRAYAAWAQRCKVEPWGRK